MNTPVHATLALATLGQKYNPRRNRSILLGALVPDLTMFGLFFYEVSIGSPQEVIWNEKYYSPLWQNTVDLFNSFPIFLAIYLVALYKKWTLLQVFCLAVFIHLATDLPLHHDDGHRHFYPLSNWRFESPLSYWDPQHYGQYWSVVEIALLIATAYVTYQLISNAIARGLLMAICTLSILMPVFFYLTLG